MATIQYLVAQGQLIKLDAGLSWREQEERQIFVFPHVVDWLRNVLPTATSIHPIESSPEEQFDTLVYEFCRGDELIFPRDVHPLRHISVGIWELKKPDLRLFGWFPAKDNFICTACDLMDQVKNQGLYGRYRDEAAQLRRLLDLDEPKFISGDNLDDVISGGYRP